MRWLLALSSLRKPCSPSDEGKGIGGHQSWWPSIDKTLNLWTTRRKSAVLCPMPLLVAPLASSDLLELLSIHLRLPISWRTSKVAPKRSLWRCAPSFSLHEGAAVLSEIGLVQLVLLPCSLPVFQHRKDLVDLILHEVETIQLCQKGFFVFFFLRLYDIFFGEFSEGGLTLLSKANQPVSAYIHPSQGSTDDLRIMLGRTHQRSQVLQVLLGQGCSFLQHGSLQLSGDLNSKLCCPSEVTLTSNSILS